jgi:hypothetical protein
VSNSNYDNFDYTRLAQNTKFIEYLKSNSEKIQLLKDWVTKFNDREKIDALGDLDKSYEYAIKSKHIALKFDRNVYETYKILQASEASKDADRFIKYIEEYKAKKVPEFKLVLKHAIAYTKEDYEGIKVISELDAIVGSFDPIWGSKEIKAWKKQLKGFAPDVYSATMSNLATIQELSK